MGTGQPIANTDVLQGSDETKQSILGSVYPKKYKAKERQLRELIET